MPHYPATSDSRSYARSQTGSALFQTSSFGSIASKWALWNPPEKNKITVKESCESSVPWRHMFWESARAAPRDWLETCRNIDARVPTPDRMSLEEDCPNHFPVRSSEAMSCGCGWEGTQGATLRYFENGKVAWPSRFCEMPPQCVTSPETPSPLVCVCVCQKWGTPKNDVPFALEQHPPKLNKIIRHSDLSCLSLKNNNTHTCAHHGSS